MLLIKLYIPCWNLCQLYQTVFFAVHTNFHSLRSFTFHPIQIPFLKSTYFYLFYLEFNTVEFFLFLKLSIHHVSKQPHLWYSYHFILQNVQNADFGRSLINLFPTVQNFIFFKLFQVFIQISLCIYQYFSKLHDSPTETKLHTLDVLRAMSFHLSRTKPF